MKSATFLAAAAVASLSMLPAAAQVVQDKKSCIQAVEDARQAYGESTTGEKGKKDAEDLIRISDHLCTQANFVYAERLLEMARGILAQE